MINPIVIETLSYSLYFDKNLIRHKGEADLVYLGLTRYLFGETNG